MNKAFAPILESERFNELLEKKVKEKSIWFVYHEPSCKLTEQQRRENLERRRKFEQERAAKMDARIQKLEEKSNEKNKKVSDHEVEMTEVSSERIGKRFEGFLI